MRDDFRGFARVGDGAQDIAPGDVAPGLGDGRVAPRVVRVRVRADDVADRPAGQFPNRRQQRIAQLLAQGVDDEDALPAHLDGHVAVFPDQHVHVALHGQHGDLRLPRRANFLGRRRRLPQRQTASNAEVLKSCGWQTAIPDDFPVHGECLLDEFGIGRPGAAQDSLQG